MPTGTIIPPIAAAIGKAALRGLRSSPATSSRLISKPTKKNGHQAVIDEQEQRLVQLKVANPNTEPDLPDLGKRLRPRGIGQRQGHGRTRQQEKTAGRLDLKEPPKGCA